MGWHLSGWVQVLDVTEKLTNFGVLGIVVILLITWYVRKDRQYERRVDERLSREIEFQREYIGLVEKYRAAMERFSDVLDSLTIYLKDRGR